MSAGDHDPYFCPPLFEMPQPAAPQPAPAHHVPRRLLAAIAALALISGFAGYRYAYEHVSGSSSTAAVSTSVSTSTGAKTLSADEIAAKIDPAIVDITTQLGSSGRAAGTGMIISSSGEILTNNHVIAGSTSITVTLTSSGASYPATLQGYDASHDVAVLKIAGVSGLPTIPAASVSTASVGDTVVAIGNALGKGGQPAVVQGVVTALNQTITAGDENGSSSETLHGLLAMNADIKPGDSGGATVDAAGNVIGMTTAGDAGVQTTAESGSTVGYAVPIDDALAIAKTIESGHETGTVHLGLHGQLGVAVQAADGAGVTVTSVQSGSAAANAGLADGDVITSVDGRSITSTDDLNDAMTATHVGDKITVTWQDANGATQSGSATLSVGVG